MNTEMECCRRGVEGEGGVAFPRLFTNSMPRLVYKGRIFIGRVGDQSEAEV